MYNNIIIFNFLVQPYNLHRLGFDIIGFIGWLYHFFYTHNPTTF